MSKKIVRNSGKSNEVGNKEVNRVRSGSGKESGKYNGNGE